MKTRVFSVLFLLLVTCFSGKSQINVRDSAVEGYIFNFGLGAYVPSGDISERFGSNMSLGIDAFYKTKSNWLIGPSFNYLFGSTVKNEDEIFKELLTADGNFIGGNGDYASVRVLERGFSLSGKFGKIIPVFGPNPNSGLLIQFGAGYLQHKIYIEDLGDAVPQLNDEYTKGYDHLHGGLALVQNIVFYHSDNKRVTNFTIGFEFMQAFTKNLRQYNYSTRSYDLEDKLDLFYGIKATWFLPIYNKNVQKFYYY